MPYQKTITLNKRSKGCHLVTEEVVNQLRDGISNTQVGLLNLFIKHTSAALTINENFDYTVRTDMDMALDRVVPESLPWEHVDEGPEWVKWYHGRYKLIMIQWLVCRICCIVHALLTTAWSVSHTKTSLIGPSLTIPITNGNLALGRSHIMLLLLSNQFTGTWQGSVTFFIRMQLTQISESTSQSLDTYRTHAKSVALSSLRLHNDCTYW